MRLFSSLVNPPSPEKIAARELQNMRLTLFQAERRLLDAQMHVDYYRDMVAFLEDVQATSIECVIDKRRCAPAPAELTQASRTASDLSTVSMAPFAA
ncbi:hypothetical protein [Cupriavidus sp. CuC1]|uniref:hypothetical protein n=1 Tax=Cupriavidus sp. CuC1 TaxID=3373131 RepID=UPI0037D5D12A